jgi:hypothetical protein
MNRRSVAGCMMGSLLAGMAAAQPVQWRVEDGGNGHWYEAVRLPGGYASFEGPIAAIGQRGATPAVFETEAEWRGYVLRVASRLSEGGNGHIGYIRPPNGQWSTWDYQPISFSAFGPGLPNNGIWQLVAAFAHPRGCSSLGCWEDYGPHETGLQPWIIEYSADCNNDGIVDKGQILSGELPDANNNGIPDGGPSITSQPVDQNAGVDTPVTFIVEVASDPPCTTPVTFQWQRRNPLVADPTATGAWIDLADGGGLLNTRTPALSILRPTPGLATGYRCKMSGGCGCEPGQGGFVYTNTVNFTIACPADFNADGGVDFGDIEEFFTRWENGC